VRTHLLYPPDALLVQAEMYGTYRLSSAGAVLRGTGAWTVAPDPGAGAPSAGSQPVEIRDGFGLLVPTGQLEPMLPLPEQVQLPGQGSPTFQELDALVPVGAGGTQGQTLAGLLSAACTPAAFADGPGALQVVTLPAAAQVAAPALAAAQARSASDVARTIDQLAHNGASVRLSRLQAVPVGPDVVYLRSIYVQPAHSTVLSFQGVVAVLAEASGNQRVAVASTLPSALAQLFPGLQIPGAPSSSKGAAQGRSSNASSSQSATNVSRIRALVAQALAEQAAAEQDLRTGNFTAYGQQESALQATLEELGSLTGTPSTTMPEQHAGAPATSSQSSSASSSPGSSGSGSSGASTSGASSSGAGATGSLSSRAGSASSTSPGPASSTASSSSGSSQAHGATGGVSSGTMQPEPGEVAWRDQGPSLRLLE